MENKWGNVGESGNEVSPNEVKNHVHGGIPPYNRQ